MAPDGPVSFDVFDTLLVRAVQPPATVFQLVARRLAAAGLARVDPADYRAARVAAERTLMDAGGGPDARVGLPDITEALCANLGLEPSLAPRLAEVELAVEEAVLAPAPAGVRQLEAARRHGRRVVFTSDMYVSAAFAEHLLRRHGLWREGDRCYLSGDLGASKSSGRLFDVVAAGEGCALRDLTHVGDSWRGDMRRAHRRGMRAVHLGHAGPTRFERRLAGAEPAAGGLAGALAGAARIARLRAEPTRPREGALVDVVTGVAAPTLLAFVAWTLQRARHHGVQRLFFVARDGQVLADLAERLGADRHGYEGELRYLHGGRSAWCLAADGDAAVDEPWVWDRTVGLSAADVLDRLGLVPAQVPTAVAATQGADAALDAAGLRRLRALLQRPEHRALVARAAAGRRRLVVDYLRQEGALSDRATAVVDIGWSGGVYRAFRRLVTEEGRTAPLGLYFDLVEPVTGCERFLSSESVRARLPALLGGAVTLMEAFTAADHGTVVGYERQGDGVAPVLAGPRAPELAAWGLATMRRLLADSADALLAEELPTGTAALQHAVVDVLAELWQHPTRDEAAAFGSFPFEDGVGRRTFRRPLARPYAAADLVPALTTRHGARRHRHEWQAGSLALTPAWLRQPLAAAAGVRRAAWLAARARGSSRSPAVPAA